MKHRLMFESDRSEHFKVPSPLPPKQLIDVSVRIIAKNTVPGVRKRLQLVGMGRLCVCVASHHHQTRLPSSNGRIDICPQKKCQRVVDARLTFCGETMATCVGTLCASMCVGHKVRHANITHLRGPKRLVLLLCGWMYRKWEESSKLSQFDGSVMGGEEWILRPTHHWRTSFKFS